MKKMKQFLILFLLSATSHTFATNYFVKPSGSNNNDGLTPATAFETLQFAADQTSPGDTVFAMAGTYTNLVRATNVLSIYHSGTSDNYIVYKNFPGETPIIKLYDQWCGIAVQGSDYIVIDGFKVVGNNDSITLAYAQSQQDSLNNPTTSCNGIGIGSQYSNPANKPHHVIVRNCNVSKCGGGGIFAYPGDYITIENNIVSECAWYSPYGNSAITLFQLYNSDTTDAIKNFIIGNICYRNEEYIPVHYSGAISDGNAISIDDSRNTQNGSVMGDYVGKTYIANNLVFDNGGRGIHCYSSDNVIVVNNTSYKNCQSPTVHDGELTAYSADSIWFINNIAWPDSGVAPIYKSNSTTAAISVENNLWAANSGLANPFGANTILGNPDFVLHSINPASADFHLQNSSIAINTGSHLFAPTIDKDGIIRLISDSVDIGCYEYFNATGDRIEPDPNLFSIFPNPASNIITLSIDDKNNTDYTIDIYNVIGTLVKTETLKQNQRQINIEDLINGVYLLTIKSKDLTTNQRLIIQR
jgi:parallel beta-helix repeat protein